MDHRRLARITKRQKGIFCHRQAIECGYSAYQIRRRLEAGEWQRVVGSSYALAGLLITPAVRDRAAALSQPGSVLAAASAARTRRVDLGDDRTYLYIGPHGQCRLAGVVAIHSSPDPSDVSLFDGIPTTNLGCAVVETARLLPERAAIELLDRSFQKGWLTTAELARRVKDRLGRRGNRRMLKLLQLVSGGERSAAERLLTRSLRVARIKGWRANAEIRDADGLIGIGDVVFDRVKLVLEVDGWAYHTTPERFQRGRERQNRLTAAGWTVLRFTWRDLTIRPDHVIGEVCLVLETLGARRVAS